MNNEKGIKGSQVETNLRQENQLCWKQTVAQ